MVPKFTYDDETINLIVQESFIIFVSIDLEEFYNFVSYIIFVSIHLEEFYNLVGI